MSDGPDPRSHWTRVGDAFDAVADLPPAERGPALDRLCRRPDGTPDAALRTDVEDLLAADDGDSVLDRPAPEKAAPLVDGREVVSDRIGVWRVVREIGRGGMGAVYLVERDGDFEQRAALKRIAVARADGVQRFERERQILASLEHPGIARLVDGGLDGGGAPYLVMEYVEGTPITSYAEQNGLSAHERVGLFLQVCDAVGFAHRHLVVHRDLKPSNVLVTNDGRAVLLDFGIARLLDAAEGDAAEAPTARTLLPALTPEYAAPEQVTGEALTTATDVYALGVVLYELLAGQRPYEIDRPTLGGIADTIREVRPAPPSSVARGRGLGRDLDTVVMKALAKDPARRYRSADTLGGDLHRVLQRLPIEARPPTVGYRLRRFVSRHRAGVGATAFAVLAVAASVAFYTGRLAEERDRANAEARTADAVSGFLVDLMADASPYVAPVDSVTVLDVLETSVARIDSGLAGEPAVQGELYRTIGSVYTSLGRYDEAEHVLARAAPYARATGDPVSLGAALIELGRLALFQARSATADSVLTRALDLLGDPAALDSTGRLHVARGLISRGGAHHWLGDLDGAVADYEAGIALCENAGPYFNDVRLNGMSALTAALSDRGEYERALATIREVVDGTRQAYPDSELRLVLARSNEARILLATDQYAETEAVLREILPVRARIMGNDHIEVSTGRARLAQALLARGEAEEAERLLDRVEPVQRATYGGDSPYVGALIRYRAHAALARGDLAAAEAAYRRALPLFGGPNLTSSRPRHRATVELAEVLDLAGRPAAARRELSAVPDSVLQATPHFQAVWGAVLARTGQPDAGLRHARAAVRTLREKAGPTSWRTARVELHLARALDATERAAEAVPLRRRAGRVLGEVRGARSAYTRATLDG